MMKKGSEDSFFFNSEAQERLSALLAKTINIVPFASDDDCDSAFSALADFCNAALESKRERKRAKFSSMAVEDLIALAGNVHDHEGSKPMKALGGGRSVKKAGESIERKEKEKEKEREHDGESERGLERSPGMAHDMESSPDASSWGFEQAYNIVRVVKVEVDPVSIRVMARPPVAGNQKPVASIMDENDLKGVGMHKGRNGTKLRKTLGRALLEYGRTCETGFPPLVLTQLKEYEWSREIADQLQENPSPSKNDE